MADVFISYSRRDSDFAHFLHQSLASRSKDVWIDWEDIPKGVDFMSEIYEGIEKANAIVFIVSQHSLVSEICQYEVAHAIKHSKRIIPVIRQNPTPEVLEPIREFWKSQVWADIAKRNWDAIGHINWIFAEEKSQFDAAVQETIDTAEQDIGYVKTHTRLLVRALEWEQSGDNPSFLLFGDEIRLAEEWLAGGDAGKSPSPDDLQRRYITESRRIADEREAQQALMVQRTNQLRRVALVAGVVGVIAIIASIFGIVVGADASQRAQEANEQVAFANETLTQVPPTLTEVAQSQGTAQSQARDAQNQVAFANETLTQVPPTLTQVAESQATAQSQAEDAQQKAQDAQALAQDAQAQAQDAQQQIVTAQAALAQADAQLTQVEPALTQFAGQQATAEARAVVADAQIVGLNATLTQIPPTLTLVAQAQATAQSDARVAQTQVAVAAEARATAEQRISESGQLILDLNATLTQVPPTLTAVSDLVIVQQRESEALRIANEANRALSLNRPDTVALLALRSLNIAYNIPADNALQLAFPSLSDLDFQGNTARVNRLAVASNNLMVASASADGKVFVWQTATGEVVWEKVFESEARTAVFSPTSALLAIGFENGTVSVFNVATEEEVNTLKYAQRIERVFFARDDRFLVIVPRDLPADLWQIATGTSQKLFTLQNIRQQRGMAMTPDLQYLAYMINDTTLGFWDTVSGRGAGLVSVSGRTVTSMVTNVQGFTVHTGHTDGIIFAWDVTGGRRLREYRGHTDVVTSLAWAVDRRVLASGSLDKTVRLWDTETGNLLRTFGVESAVYDVRFSPDGRNLYVADEQGLVRRFALAVDSTSQTLETYPVNIVQMQLAMDGQTMFVITESNLEWWNAQTGTLLHRNRFDGGANGLTLTIAPDGRTMYSAHRNQALRAWSGVTNNNPNTLTWTRQVSIASAVAISPTNKFIAVLDSNYKLYTFDSVTTVAGRWLYNGAQLVEGATVTSVSPVMFFTADESEIVIIEGSRILHVAPETGEVLRERELPQTFNVFALSPDGKTLATASRDNFVRLHDIETLEVVRVFSGHTDVVTAIAFSPNGEQLYTGSVDRTVRIWNIEEGSQLRQLNGHTGAVTQLVALADGRVISGAGDRTLRLWETRVDVLIDRTCARLYRDLTDTERLTYGITDTTPACGS